MKISTKKRCLIIFQVTLTLSDDVAVVGQGGDDLVPDPPDGNVDPIPHCDPETL